ncbi:hypothetical protein L0665_04930 [Methanogenium marinum]|uniref:Uncharacterized protein n=1 Tax=Methanogenium marinum TaxID=348610 RepID=A0A9Q4KP12_9EURY|nr:hypothetical protein [Methanogenium marinum]MDE4907953.1 hypothetical protein [Methanogenium marinum]
MRHLMGSSFALTGIGSNTDGTAFSAAISISPAVQITHYPHDREKREKIVGWTNETLRIPR